ncbi:MAG: hypothetical protein ABSF38_00845 [Verrucomicrobiota bacterium]|jgi:hypothetical protein
MKTTLPLTRWIALATVLLCALHPSSALAQGTTAFTYQGQLSDTGTNANGAYAMIFNLYDAASGGDLIGGPITNSATLANGLFTVNLDFGAGAFNGAARWLDITVQCGTNSETLGPRVQVLASPYALFASAAGTANTASNLNVNGGSVIWSQAFPPYGTSSWNLKNGYSALITNSLIEGNSTNFEGTLSLVGGSGVAALQIWDDPQSGTQGVSSRNFMGGTFSGDGSGLTNLNAVPNMQVFTNNGTFVVPSNVTRIMVEVWGGGGGGGDGVEDQVTDGYGGAGGAGGAGGYGKGVFFVTVGASFPVTAGDGGADNMAGQPSSFGSLISADGGSPGGAGTLRSDGEGGYFGSDGNAGIGGGSDGAFSITGGSGNSYMEFGGSAGYGGSGGLGDGGAGNAPGGGGSGASGFNGGGGAGGQGRVVVYW